MMPNEAAVWGIIISTAIFYSLSFLSKSPSTVREFFHDRNLKLNVVSLIVVNLALASTLVFILDGTLYFGLLYLLAPLALLAGQWFYGYLVSNIAPQELFSRGTLLTGIADQLDNNAQHKVYFRFTIVLTVGLTYLFSLAYEIFVSGQLLATTIAPHHTVATELLTVAFILTIVMLYTLTGGYRTVQRTDFAQFIVSIFLLGGLIALLISLTNHTKPSPNPAPWIPSDPWSILGFLTLILTPFTTQLYGLLNNTMASHQESSTERARLFKFARIVTVLVLIALASASFYYNHIVGGTGAKAAVMSWIADQSAANTPMSYCIIAFVAAGMCAIIMSTVDTLLIAITQASLEGLWNRSSKDDRASLKAIRLSMLLLWPITIGILGLAWYKKPDAFSILFAIASPCEALAPLILLLIVLAKRKHITLLVGEGGMGRFYIFLFYALMGTVLIIALYALSNGKPWTRSVGFFAMLTSLLLTLPIFWRSRNHLRKTKIEAAALVTP